MQNPCGQSKILLPPPPLCYHKMSTHSSITAFRIYIKTTYSECTCHLCHVASLKLINLITMQLLKAIFTAKESVSTYNAKICKNTTIAYFKYQSLYLALLENPFLRSFCTQFLNILKHVQNNIFNMHCKEKNTCLIIHSVLHKEKILMNTNMEGFIFNYTLIHQDI